MVPLWQTNLPGTYSKLEIAIIYNDMAKDYVVWSAGKILVRRPTLIKAQAFVIQMLRQDLTNDIAEQNKKKVG